MSICTQDKVCLFALSYRGLMNAIERWFEVMAFEECDREHFDVEVKQVYNHHPRPNYFRAVLHTSENHHMSDHIEHAMESYKAVCPEVGVEHFCHYIDGDGPTFLGCPTPWGRSKAGNAWEWHQKYVEVSHD